MKPGSKPSPLWNPYVGGVLLGLVLFLAFLLAGHGLGASGGIARLLGAGMNVVAPDHVQTNFFFGRYIDQPLIHWIVPLTLGVVLGGFVSAKLGGRLKVETLRGPGISPRTRWIFAPSPTSTCSISWMHGMCTWISCARSASATCPTT